MFIIYVPAFGKYRDIAKLKNVFSPVFLSDTLARHVMNGTFQCTVKPEEQVL